MSAVLLDGAMGTALLARGLPTGAIPEAWLLERPDEIARVHAAHAGAGAQVVLTCTFNLASPRLGALPPEALARTAVALARRAAPRARIAGDLGPTGLFGPGRPPPPLDAVRRRYTAAARALVAAGAELVWLESQWDLAEARAALEAVRDAAPEVAVTFTAILDADRPARLPDGTPLLDALEAVADRGAAIAGVNCVPAGEPLAAVARGAAGRVRAAFAVKPSPGLPGAVLPPDAFAAALAPAIRAGARHVGGCCGATAAHVAAVAALVGGAQGSATARG